MKFIGQYIQSFIARFRSDVYLEDIDTGTIASGGNLGLDSNNKIVKAAESSGGISHDGSTANGVLTFKDADEATVEANLTFDGTDALISSTGKLSFRDANSFINSPTANDLEIVATDIVLDAGASIELDAVSTITLKVGDDEFLDFKNVNNTFARFDAESGAGTSLFLYEQGGDSLVDYCSITVLEHGATTIATVDAAAAAANLAFSIDGQFSVASTGIDIAGNGTITNATWNGTAIATDQQKHLAYFEFEGFSVGDGTNYMIAEINSDTKAPFEHQTSTGSDGLTATGPVRLLKTAGHVMPYAGTLKLWKGWATSSGGAEQTVDVGLYKATLVNNDSDDISPAVLINTSFTSVGNSTPLSFSEDSFSVAFAAGDILISAIRNGTSGKRCDFSSTLVVEWN